LIRLDVYFATDGTDFKLILYPLYQVRSVGINAELPGSAAVYTGRKRSLHEGGIRVPGLIEWPAKIKSSTRTQVPAGTMNYFPIIMAMTGLNMPDGGPLDGVNLLPLIEGSIDFFL